MVKHKMGIIGFGGMAGYHYNCLKSYDRAEVVGIWDINPERLEAAEKLGLKAYKSQDEILHDNSLDWILIATTNKYHMEIAIAAMEAGKNVICEKPVTMSCEELQQIMDVAKKTGKIFSIDQNRRTNKDFFLVKDNIAKGVIGKPYFIESRVSGARGIPNGWRCIKSLGGGMMLDWGVHLIDQIMYMIPSKVTSVYCKMFFLKYEADDNFKLIINFEDGCCAQVEVCTNSFIALPRWYVCGENGTLMINDWNCDGKIICAKDTDVKWEEEIIYTKAGPTKTMAPRSVAATEEIILSEPDVIDSVHIVYDQFLNAVEGKAELTITAEQAMRVMKVMEAAFESNEIDEVIKTDI
jgi:predicted dehydrogenase